MKSCGQTIRISNSDANPLRRWGRQTMSAPEAKTDVPREPEHFRFEPKAFGRRPRCKPHR
jgi:hypothetical protein